jgi:hypothetical protein
MSEALNVLNGPWRAVLGGDQTVAALTVAQEVAARLQDPNQIEVATAAAARQLQRRVKDLRRSWLNRCLLALFE